MNQITHADIENLREAIGAVSFRPRGTTTSIRDLRASVTNLEGALGDIGALVKALTGSTPDAPQRNGSSPDPSLFGQLRSTAADINEVAAILRSLVDHVKQRL